MAATNVATISDATKTIFAFGDTAYKTFALSGTLSQSLTGGETGVTCASSNTAVCTVTASANVSTTNWNTVTVTAVGAGTSTITVSVAGGPGGGTTKTCAVTVSQAKKRVLERGADDTTQVQYDANNTYADW